MLKPGDIVYIVPNSAKVTTMSKLEVFKAVGVALSPVATAAALTK